MKITLLLMTPLGISLHYVMEVFMCGTTLEHIDHVTEVVEGILDGNNIPLARVKQNTVNQIHPFQILTLCPMDTIGTV